jgi:uncharacterized membrane protein
MAIKEVKKLTTDQNEHLAKFQKIVQGTIDEEELIINNLLHPPKDIISPGQNVSDKVARFGGSWKFIIIFIAFFAVWIVLNIIVLFWVPFDPYPFILMNLILSMIAALQAPVILMSQNRQSEKDRMRDENDYLINMKAEMEIRSLHQKMDLLLEEQIKTLFDTQAKQFTLLETILKHVKSKETKS